MRAISRRSFVGLMATSAAMALAGCSGQPPKAAPAANDAGATSAAEEANAEPANRDVSSPFEGEGLAPAMSAAALPAAFSLAARTVTLNEIHPYYQDARATEFIQGKGIAVQAWYPLGGRGHNDELLADPALAAIAGAHGVSIPQVILRWNLQRGVVVIPGSSNAAHIREDDNIYGFELTDEEMAAIAALDRNEKHDWY